MKKECVSWDLSRSFSGSSTDFADFLTAVSSANPQKLADKILGEALGLSSNSAGDDMTVVACKIFER